MPTILAHETQNFADVGSYSVIFMLKSMVVLPAWTIALALQPSAESAWASNQPQTGMRVFHMAMAAGGTTVMVLATFVVFFATDLMTIFGKDFAPQSAELQLMMIAAVAEAYALTFSMRVQTAGRMWGSIFATLLPRDAVMLAVVIVMAPQYGLRGAIIAHSVGAIVNLMGVYWLSVRSVRGLHQVRWRSDDIVV
jgi:Na+-driven multidrug efflux pump